MKSTLAMTKQEIRGNRDELRGLYDRIGLSVIYYSINYALCRWHPAILEQRYNP